MFNSKTVFIIGAGAGVDIGMPVGHSLKDKISQRLDFSNPQTTDLVGDRFVHAAIQRQAKMDDISGKKIISYMNAARYIKEGMPTATSIDTFIDTHRGNKEIEVCGKLGIVRSILAAERGSKLFFDTRNTYNKMDFSKVTETWFMQFFHLLVGGIVKDETHKIFENVAFINFNYDRCLEHFLCEALRNHYVLTPDDAMNLVNRCKILHPYGSVGPNPYLANIVNEAYVPFGSSDRNIILELSRNIKTFTDQIEDRNFLSEIRELVKQADTIVFLGFAFHDQNMELLYPDSRGRPKRVFASAHGISKSDCGTLTDKIYKLTGGLGWPSSNDFQLRNDLTCSGIFTEFQRILIS